MVSYKTVSESAVVLSAAILRFQNDDNEVLLTKKVLVSLFRTEREGAHRTIDGHVRLERGKHTANKC